MLLLLLALALDPVHAGPPRADVVHEVGIGTSVVGLGLFTVGTINLLSPGKRLLTLSEEYERTSFRRGIAYSTAGAVGLGLGSGVATWGSMRGRQGSPAHWGVAAWSLWGLGAVEVALGFGSFLPSITWGLSTTAAIAQQATNRRTHRGRSTALTVVPWAEPGAAGALVAVRLR